MVFIIEKGPIGFCRRFLTTKSDFKTKEPGIRYLSVYQYWIKCYDPCFPSRLDKTVFLIVLPKAGTYEVGILSHLTAYVYIVTISLSALLPQLYNKWGKIVTHRM